MKTIVLLIIILLISVFPVFMSPTRSIWDHKEDHKKVAQNDEVEGEEGIL